MKRNSGKSAHLQAVTMIDTATGWRKICIVPSSKVDLVFNSVERVWLIYCPLSRKVIMDRGKKSLYKFREITTNDFGMKVSTITSRNPKANAII